MRTLYKPSLRGPRKRTNSLLPICIPWNMLHIVPALSIVQNAASTSLLLLITAPVVPIRSGLVPDIESVKPWPNFIRSTYRYYSFITFQVGCISCHPFLVCNPCSPRMYMVTFLWKNYSVCALIRRYYFYHHESICFFIILFIC